MESAKHSRGRSSSPAKSASSTPNQIPNVSVRGHSHLATAKSERQSKTHPGAHAAPRATARPATAPARPPRPGSAHPATTKPRRTSTQASAETAALPPAQSLADILDASRVTTITAVICAMRKSARDTDPSTRANRARPARLAHVLAFVSAGRPPKVIARDSQASETAPYPRAGVDRRRSSDVDRRTRHLPRRSKSAFYAARHPKL